MKFASDSPQFSYVEFTLIEGNFSEETEGFNLSEILNSKLSNDEEETLFEVQFKNACELITQILKQVASSEKFQKISKVGPSFLHYPLKTNPIEFWEKFIQMELLKIRLQRNDLLRNSKKVPSMNVC